MLNIFTYSDASEFIDAPTRPEWPQVSTEYFDRVKPDLHIVAADSTEVLARCSVWWLNTPPLEGQRLGLFGHYAAEDFEASNAVLNHATQLLRSKGCTMTVGPLDGNIWNKYRLITWSNGRDPFFLEMQNPPEWPEYILRFGFRSFHQYQSREVKDLDKTRVSTSRFAKRLRDRGILLRDIDTSRIDSELEAIYDVSVKCFTDRPLYTRQGKSMFLQQYRSVLSSIDTELITLVQDEDRVVGFMFAIPDMTQKARGERIESAMIKTIAVLPDQKYRGIGTMLYDRVHSRARDRGYRTVLHSFIHDDNKIAMDISRSYNSELIRKYSLYAMEL